MTTVGSAKKANTIQPLSPRSYAAIALAGFMIGVGLLLFYVYWVPNLVADGAQNQVYYLLLIPWAIACAAFLFGVMRSYATFTHRHFGNALELGGPVVLFCLVVVGGFKLVPEAPQAFDLTVRAHSDDGKEPIIRSGSVTIDLDNNRQTKTFDASTGEANFKGLPSVFRGAVVNILPQVRGYQEKWQMQKPQGQVLNLALVPLPPMHLSGSIVPIPADWKELRVVMDGQRGDSPVDDLGRFDLEVGGTPGDRVRLKIYARNDIVYDDYQILPGPITLKLHRR